MAEWHLEDLRRALWRRGWSIAARPGDDYRVSATWQLTRPRDDRTLFIDFGGLDDMCTLPLKESYGSKARHLAEGLGNLYFRRARSTELWRDDLSKFVEALEQ